MAFDHWRTGDWCWLPPDDIDIADTESGSAGRIPAQSRNCNSNSNSNRPRTEASTKREEDKDASAVAVAVTLSSSSITPAVVKSAVSEDNHDESGWKPGNWCWLPPYPPEATPSIGNEELISRENANADANTIANANANANTTEQSARGNQSDIVASPSARRTTRTPRDRPPPRRSSRVASVGTFPARARATATATETEPDSDGSFDDNDDESQADDQASDTETESERERERERENNEHTSLEGSNNGSRHATSRGRNRRREREDGMWKAKFQLLVEYQTAYGTTNVPCSDPALGDWVRHQRRLHKKGTISRERIALLESLGFEWVLRVACSWDDMYQRLVAYKNKYFTTRVPQSYKEDPKLGQWVKAQRSSCKIKGRINRLDEIGFVWNANDEVRRNWDEMYERLVAYSSKYGSTRVPRVYEEDLQLGRWVSTQRRCCKSKERIDRLNEIGFVWTAIDNYQKPTEIHENAWEAMYQRLVDFQAKHNTTRVPSKFKTDPRLGIWVQRQRERCKRAERVRRLNAIGFVWHAEQSPEEKWEMMYQRLVEYKEQHKTTCVPKKYEKDLKLSNWVRRQRFYCKQKNRIDRLDAIGFVWDARKTNETEQE